MFVIRNLAFLLGRILIAALFLYDGYLTVKAPNATAGFIGRVGLKLPVDAGTLALALAAVMLVGGVLIIIGLWTRVPAILLAAFCVATAVLFHYHPNDANEMIQMGKDLGLAGGFLFLAAAGPGLYSVDARRRGGMI